MGPEQRTTETGLVELPETAASSMCPWCAGPVEETFRRDRGVLGHRYVAVTLRCDDCDLVIRLDWPSAPHRVAPHG